MLPKPENEKRKNAANNNVDDKPKFGRLLVVLIFTVFLIAVITWASEAYWS